MARRRRRGGTWFPVSPTVYGDGTTPHYPDQTWYEYQTILPATDGEDNTFSGWLSDATAIPLTLDQTPQYDSANPGAHSLRDFTQGQDYLLQRVVGKVWTGWSTQDNVRAQRCLVCCALAILPVDDGTQDTPAIDNEDFNPLNSANSQQPWIWRRTWVLGGTPVSGLPSGLYGFPGSSAGYGSVADGGHLDSKIKRRVTKEQRLFFVSSVAIMTVFAGPGVDQSAAVNIGYDLRILGSMRRGRNTSTFK